MHDFHENGKIKTEYHNIFGPNYKHVDKGTQTDVIMKKLTCKIFFLIMKIMYGIFGLIKTYMPATIYIQISHSQHMQLCKTLTSTTITIQQCLHVIHKMDFGQYNALDTPCQIHDQNNGMLTKVLKLKTDDGQFLWRKKSKICQESKICHLPLTCQLIV